MATFETIKLSMDSAEAKQRIETLKRELEEHSRRYYVENAPIISDYDFDLLMQELSRLEEIYPEFATDDSPTRRVGSDLSSSATPFKQYPHLHPMLSLANTYNIGELNEFDNRIQKQAKEPFKYNCELKFDGTGINLLYKNGVLIRALTRGDGTIGDDVTNNVKRIKSIPQKLRGGSGYPAEFEIRGEIYMPFETFDRLNAEREIEEEPLFANPRNAAAGSLKMLNPDDVAKRGLQCVLYHIIAEDYKTTEHSEALKEAARWGLPISEYSKVCNNIEEVVSYITLWDTKRRTLGFPTDGVVVKVNNFALQRSLGYTAKTPRWAVAYKFKPEEALTQITSIDYQVGRTGAVTPVANLQPVQLSGTIVKRATLHNADQMKLLDIHIGDYVYVEKGGEIIPKITKVEFTKRGPDIQVAEFPQCCPVCGTPLVRDEQEAKFFCPNTDGCPPQTEGKILHFCSRKALNINIGEVAVSGLCSKGYVKNPEDLYALSDFQLLSLDKWREKSVSNFYASLEKSKSVPFARVLFGLGIRFIGESTAKSLASKFKSIEGLQNATREELLATQDVGESLAESLINYFKVPAHIETITKLKEVGLQFAIGEESITTDELSGMTIMITGTFSIPRETLKLYIEAHGGKVGSSVTSSTTYLLSGDKPGGEKIKKAEKLNIPIISEEEFYKIAAPSQQRSGSETQSLSSQDEATLF